MARKFQFRLQKLLEIREHKEKLIKNELGKAMAKRVREVEKKNQALANIELNLQKMREEENNNTLSVNRLMQYQSYLKKLKYDIAEQDNIISIIDEEIAMINKKLIAARKDKKILERLKARKKDVYMYEMNKEEQNFFDDIGNVEFVRKIRDYKKLDAKAKQEIPIKYKNANLNNVDFIHQIYQEVFGGM